jgi:hypothetical protein
MIPGQLRPTFAGHDREKRIAMTVVAVLLALTGFATFNASTSWLFVGALIVELVILQVVYAARIRVVREATTKLSETFPTDRFLIGNARFMGASHRDPRTVRFVTVILQFSEAALTIWNPDSSATPLLALPLSGLGVETVKSKPPRWRLRSLYSSSDTYLAIFKSAGFRFEHFEELTGMAPEYFPTVKSRDVEPQNRTL